MEHVRNGSWTLIWLKICSPGKWYFALTILVRCRLAASRTFDPFDAVAVASFALSHLSLPTK